ncbi:MAG: 2-C-methyl-D-erythritol 4-phosphate cytidylyltransferase [Oscillospiraceae bacterium]|nr:2-C-methyl-D-erythritol 4-phosphate cytidylyltransferase [Oscillospiraceae bacterium]
MNTVVIFAGGAGQRMNSKTLPKQFLELHGKPIIIYTLEQFDDHPLVDGIVVACLPGWEKHLERLIRKFAIEKVKAIVPGGVNGQESIFNALHKLTELYDPSDVVMIHDGVRPLIDADTISANIESVKKYGSGITVSPAIETVTIGSDDNKTQVGQIIDRSLCRMAKAPQSFLLGDIHEAHLKARQDGLLDFIDSASLMQHYGHSLHTVDGPATNIKITTPTDFYIFRAIVDARESQQILGY